MDLGNQTSLTPDRDAQAEPGIQAPRPESGFYRTTSSVFYVTGDGRVFLVSAPGEHVCLRPRDELAADAVRVVDITGAALLLVADTAEQLASPSGRHLRADAGRDARVLAASLLQDLLVAASDTIGHVLLDEQPADVDALHERVGGLVLTSQAHRRRLSDQRVNSRGRSRGLPPPPPSIPRLALPFRHRGDYVGWFTGMLMAGEALGVASVRDAHLRGDLWTVSQEGILHVFRCRAMTLADTGSGSPGLERPSQTVGTAELQPAAVSTP
ncbi:MAG TPA: hypothetical protein VGB85_31730 [Nannocystis sp.]|jgi:hypothetical protein